MSTMLSTTTTSALFSPSLTVRRITVEEFDRIVESRALKDSDRIELIDGYLVTKMPKSPQHGYSTRKMVDGLGGLIGPGRTWRSEQPIRIPDYDEPEPDFSIVRGTTEDYAYRLPGPADVLLLVEIALSSLDQDRGEKWRAYARGRIPVYWIVDLVHRQVEVHTDPGPDGYRTSQVFTEGQEIPIFLDGQPVGRIAVATILPPLAPTATTAGA